MHFRLKVLEFILTHTFLVLATIALGHGEYRKLYTCNWGSTCTKVWEPLA